MNDGKPYRLRDGGVDLFVRLTPKSARDAIDGVATTADGRTHLTARVRAVPEKGEANRALIRLVARTLRLRASDVGITSGETARVKTLRISADPEPVIAAIEAFLANTGPA